MPKPTLQEAIRTLRGHADGYRPDHRIARSIRVVLAALAAPAPADGESADVGVLDWAIQVCASNGYVTTRESVYEQERQALADAQAENTRLRAAVLDQVGELVEGNAWPCLCPDSFIANDVPIPDCPRHTLGPALMRALAATPAPTEDEGGISAAPGDPMYDRLISIVHDALFYEHDDDGPVFRWSETRLVSDDDSYLKVAANAVVNALLQRAADLAALAAAPAPTEDDGCTCSPCTTPAYGAPGLAHCAACCYGTGIEDYSHDCPVAEHRTCHDRDEENR